jgi:putative transposase
MKKIKLYPTTSQRKILQNWINVYRFVYNKALSDIRNNNAKIDCYELRNKHVTMKNNLSIKDFEKNVPKVIRQEAIRDLCKAYKTCFSQMKTSMIDSFNLNYKTKKKKNTSIGIEKECSIEDDCIKMFPTFFNENDIYFKVGKRQKKELKCLEINHDCRIQYKNSEYFLLIPTKEYIKNDNIQKNNIIALDPGTRTFFTGYDPDGNIIEIDKRDLLFNKLKKRIDLFTSLRAKKKIKKKCVMKRIKRLKNLVDDLHWKAITYLTDSYDNILLPEFESQKLAQKSENKYLNRDLTILSHYTFKQRLLYKSTIKKCKVYIVNEAYTSKTCSKCGNIKEIKNDKIYKCTNKSCKVLIGRDINAARNILLKYIQSV